MINNLIKIEKEIKKIEEIKNPHKYFIDLKEILTIEKLNTYKTENIFDIVVNGKVSGLQKPTLFNKLKLINDNSDNKFCSESLKKVVSCNNVLKEHWLKKEGKLFFDDSFFTQDIYIRTKEMYEVIKKEIVSDKCHNLVSEKTKDFLITCDYNTINFTFDINMLTDDEKDALNDICINLQAYIIHPEIGVKIIEKELDNILGKYYNKNILFIKKDTNKYYEFEILK